MGHVAAGAVALSRLQSGGGIIELTLRDKRIDLGKAVGTVERESHPVVYVPRLPVGHDHGQVFLEFADVRVRRGAVFGSQILIEIGSSGGIGFHPALIFGEIVALSPQQGAHQERAYRQTEGKFHGALLLPGYTAIFSAHHTLLRPPIQRMGFRSNPVEEWPLNVPAEYDPTAP